MGRYRYRVTLGSYIPVSIDIEVQANNKDEAGQIACETAPRQGWETLDGVDLLRVETIDVEKVKD